MSSINFKMVMNKDKSVLWGKVLNWDKEDYNIIRQELESQKNVN